MFWWIIHFYILTPDFFGDGTKWYSQVFSESIWLHQVRNDDPCPSSSAVSFLLVGSDGLQVRWLLQRLVLDVLDGHHTRQEGVTQHGPQSHQSRQELFSALVGDMVEVSTFRLRRWLLIGAFWKTQRGLFTNSNTKKSWKQTRFSKQTAANMQAWTGPPSLLHPAPPSLSVVFLSVSWRFSVLVKTFCVLLVVLCLIKVIFSLRGCFILSESLYTWVLAQGPSDLCAPWACFPVIHEASVCVTAFSGTMCWTETVYMTSCCTNREFASKISQWWKMLKESDLLSNTLVQLLMNYKFFFAEIWSLHTFLQWAETVFSHLHVTSAVSGEVQQQDVGAEVAQVVEGFQMLLKSPVWQLGLEDGSQVTKHVCVQRRRPAGEM